MDLAALQLRLVEVADRLLRLVLGAELDHPERRLNSRPEPSVHAYPHPRERPSGVVMTSAKAMWPAEQVRLVRSSLHARSIPTPAKTAPRPTHQPVRRNRPRPARAEPAQPEPIISSRRRSPRPQSRDHHQTALAPTPSSSHPDPRPTCAEVILEIGPARRVRQVADVDAALLAGPLGRLERLVVLPRAPGAAAAAAVVPAAAVPRRPVVIPICGWASALGPWPARGTYSSGRCPIAVRWSRRRLRG